MSVEGGLMRLLFEEYAWEEYCYWKMNYKKISNH